MTKGAVADAPPKVKGVVKRLPIDRLFESPNNPRQIADDPAQQELNADVAARGVLTPLLAREVKGGKYEVLAGARRLKAAKAAKIKDLDVRVVEADDEQAHEIMVVENLQRKNIHPLDEAINFQLILDRTNGDATALAKRVNKKPAYIQRVLVLNRLLPKFKELFRKGTLELDAAIAVARLQETDQKSFLVHMEQSKKANAFVLSDVQDWTMRYVLRELDRAPWDVKDPTLHPPAGACTTCPKQTGVCKDMFADIAEGTACTDGPCFSKKLDLHMVRMAAKLGSLGVHFWHISQDQYETEGKGPDRVLGTKDYLPTTADKKCDNLTKGLVKKGLQIGTAVWICINTKCKVHKLSLGNHGERVSAAEAEKIKDQRQDRVEETKVRDRVLTAIVNSAAKGLTPDESVLVTESVFGRLWHEHKKKILQRHGLLKPKSNVKVEAAPDYDALFAAHAKDASGYYQAQLLLEMALIDEVDPGTLDAEADNLYVVAKDRKVDVKDIKAIVAEEIRQSKLPKKSKTKK